MADTMNTVITLDQGAAHRVRQQLLIGLASYGELERLRGRAESLKGAGLLPEGMWPQDCNGDAAEITKFAEALVYVDPPLSV